MEDIRRYETVIVLSPTLVEKDISNFIVDVENFIKHNKGKIIYSEKIGIIDLAYKISNNMKGYFYFCEFSIEAEKIIELDKLYRISESIIRYIIVSLCQHGIKYNDSLRCNKVTVKQNIILSKVKGVVEQKLIDFSKKMYCRFKRFGIKYVDYKNVNFLIRFLNPQGKILPRRLTGNTLKYQKKVATAIKRARHLSILPFVCDNLK
jgi:small subunit ribosomal protein S18